VHQEHGEVQTQRSDIGDAPTGRVFGRQEAGSLKQCAQGTFQLAVDVPDLVRQIVKQEVAQIEIGGPKEAFAAVSAVWAALLRAAARALIGRRSQNRPRRDAG